MRVVIRGSFTPELGSIIPQHSLFLFFLDHSIGNYNIESK